MGNYVLGGETYYGPDVVLMMLRIAETNLWFESFGLAYYTSQSTIIITFWCVQTFLSQEDAPLLTQVTISADGYTKLLQIQEISRSQLTFVAVVELKSEEEEDIGEGNRSSHFEGNKFVNADES